MKTLHLSIALIISIAIATSSSAKCTGEGHHDAAALRTICDLEAAWGQSFVNADATVAKRMLADDFVGVDTKGRLYHKADEIADISKPAHFASDVLNDVTVRFYGDTAIAQGSDSWTGKKGEKGRFVWTDVWLKRGGVWQIVAAEDLIPPAAK
jgi:ketosteroid isomerase-like protein